ncbi:MAG: alpha/beta fold hydrolase [Gemmatimonadota bacterium]
MSPPPSDPDIPEIDLTVYPDECDAFGHLNQAAFLSLFERARWEMLARGPGMDVFTRNGTWPAVRRAVIDYHAAAFPGDVLRFQQSLVHHGRTSFTMRQTARRVSDDTLIATAEFVFVCISRGGRPVPVPEEVGRFMSKRGGSGDGRDLRRLTVNGVNLAVGVREDATPGPALLLIHGFPLDHTIWRHQLDNLHGIRRLAPDLRGLGRSDAPDLGYSMATYAADLIALLDALGVDDVVLCGMSMGGYVAFEFIRQARHRVKGLILVDTRAEADSVEGRRARDAMAQLARERGAKAVADQMILRLFAPGTASSQPTLVRDVHELMAGMPTAGVIGAIAAMRDRPDSTPLLATLDMPALVIVGADDPMVTPEAAHAMARQIPGARVAVVPGAGHLPMLEQPAETTQLIKDFLEGLAKG